MESSRSVTLMSRAFGLVRSNAAFGSVVAVAIGLFVGTPGLALISGGNNKSVAISWTGVPVGDPSSLDDGFEHWVVTFDTSVLELHVGPDTAPIDALPAEKSSTEKQSEGGVTRRIPLETNAAGEISGNALLELAKLGDVLGIVSDGSITYAEIALGEAQDKSEDNKGSDEVDNPSKTPDLDRQDKDDPLADLLHKVGGTKKVSPVMAGVYAVVTTADKSAYENLAGVVDVDEDIVLSVATNDPNYSNQWGLKNTGAAVNGRAGTPGADIGVEDAWVVSQGMGQVVAIVDTGIEITHPDLANAIWKNPGEICANGKDDEANGYIDDCNGWDFANNDASVFDPSADNRHATHIAGIIAAGTNNGIGVAGIAPATKIMSVKSGNGNSFRLSDGARGIAYAAANGATVINCSFGTPAGTPYDAVSTMATAIEQARAKGVVVAVAAGNDGRNIDTSPTYPASFPHDNIVSVGSTTNTDTQSSFSNWGTSSVDLHAPGSDILSTLPGGSYGGMSGTSMATPMVAGAVALIRSVMPSLSPTEIKTLLMKGSTTLTSLTGYSGSGARLDVGAILNSASTSSSEPVRFSFDGFAGAIEGTETSSAVRSTVASDQVPSGNNVAVRATLLTALDGVTHGVVGAAVRTSTALTVTDDEASVVLSPTGGFTPRTASTSMPYGFSLPAGEYALVAEAYTTSDGETLGRPWAVFFTVAAKGQVAPNPIVAPAPSAGAPVSPPASGTNPPPALQPTPTPSPPPWYSPSPTPSAGGSPTIGGGGDTWSYPVYDPRIDGSSPNGSSGGLPTGGTWGSSPPPASGPNTWEWHAPSAPPSYQPSNPLPMPSSPTWNPAPLPNGGGGGGGGSGSVPAPGPSAQPNLPPAPAPVTSGSLTISAISPRMGSSDGNQLVFIDGRGFRPTLYVRFGTRSARVLAMSSTQIVVVTPSHVAGLSDLTVAISGGDSVTMPNAFTFVDASTGPVAPAPSVGSGGGGTAPAPVAPAPPAPSGGGGGGSQPLPSPDATPVPSPDTGGMVSPTIPSVLPTRFSFGDPIDGPSGTRLRPVIGFSPLSRHSPVTWSTQICRMSSCQGTRLQ